MARRSFCRECGARLVHAPVGRPKDFCTQAEQRRFWARADRIRRKEAEVAKIPGRNEWYAPQWVRDEVQYYFDVAVDVAASPESTWVPENWLGPQHPTRQDGLDEDWTQLAGEGAAWMNAPWTPPELLARFVQKAAETAANGTTVVALLPDRRRRDWYRRWVVAAGAHVTEIPRLRMAGPHSTGHSAREDMVLVVWVGRAPRPRTAHVWGVAHSLTVGRLQHGDLFLLRSRRMTSLTLAGVAAPAPSSDSPAPRFWPPGPVITLTPDQLQVRVLASTRPRRRRLWAQPPPGSRFEAIGPLSAEA